MPLGYSRDMKAVWLEVPSEFLDQRRSYGRDKRDEVWDGVLHMVPPARTNHVDIQQRLSFVLKAIAERRGLRAYFEMGLFDPAVPEYENYRVPDLSVVAPKHVSKRGIEGRAELVIEVLSPNDESREKVPFYERMGVREVWLLDRERRTIEVFALAPPSLGIEVRIAGADLVIRDGADIYTIDLRDVV